MPKGGLGGENMREGVGAKKHLKLGKGPYGTWGEWRGDRGGPENPPKTQKKGEENG